MSKHAANKSSDVSHRSDVLAASSQSKSMENSAIDTLPSIRISKGRLSQQKRCFICFKSGPHVQGLSYLRKTCYYCGKGSSHNRCICLQKFSNPEMNVVVPVN